MSASDDPQYQQQQLEPLTFQTLADRGIDPHIVQKLRLCIDNGRLTTSDIDNHLCEQLCLFPADLPSVNALFDEFERADLTGVVNKSAFVCNLIKQWRTRHPHVHGSSDIPTKNRPGPDETKLKDILDRTGYKLEVTTGQRKYGGPPPDGPDRPVDNSEIFIGKLPRELFEDELIPLCEQVGKIWDLRLMIDPASGWSKGYCFVTYCSPSDAAQACEQLNGYAIRPGKLIQANVSVAKLRLFIGNVPKTKSKEEIQEELAKVVEGVVNVIVYASADDVDTKKNRGFCFVDFDMHKNASAAKRKLSSGRVRIFSRDIAVAWADPAEEPTEDVMAQVKVLYVRNLTSDVSETDVKQLFLPFGSIEHVRKVRDYAFVHYDKREEALNAMQVLNGKTLGRNAMEICLAKPINDKRKQAQLKREQQKQYEPPPYPSGRGGYRGRLQRGGLGNNSQRGNGRAMNRLDDPMSVGPMREGFIGLQRASLNARGRGSSNSGYGEAPRFNNSTAGNYSYASNHPIDFGAFSGAPSNSSTNRFGANPMQFFVNMKRASNSMNDGYMPKRPRFTNSVGSDPAHHGPWYQDRGYGPY